MKESFDSSWSTGGSGHLPEDIAKLLRRRSESTSTSNSSKIASWEIHDGVEFKTGHGHEFGGISNTVRDLSERVGGEKWKSSTLSVEITFLGVTVTTVSRFTASTTPFSGDNFEGDDTSSLGLFTSKSDNITSFKTELSVLTETIETVSSIFAMSLKCSSESSSRLESDTISSDKEIFISKGRIKWEFSLRSGSGTSLIQRRDKKPDFSIFTSSFLSVVRSGRFLSERWESIFGDNERLPLTRFGGSSVTINLSGEFGLIPKNSRAGSRSESVDLKFTR
jgi:hypothetical protein